MMERSVLSKADFIDEASKKFILLEIDLPDRKRQSPALRAQNEELVRRFRVQMFPTYIVLDSDGGTVAKNVGPPGRGVSGFLGWLERIR